MNKFMKKIVTGILAITMVLGTVLSVSADTGLQEDGKAIITKTVNVAPGVTYASETFTFKAEKVGLVNTDGTVNKTPALKALMPELTSAIVNFTDIDMSSATLNSDGLLTKSMQTTDLLKDKGSAFPHAGVYVYTITEDATVATSGMQYSKAEYQMIVYVENVDLATDNSTIVTNVGFRKVKDDLGVATPAESMTAPEDTDDIIPQTSGKAYPKADPIFVNELIPLVDLEVQKEVAGRFADTTLPFSYALTLERPITKAVAAETADKEYTGYIKHANGAANTVFKVTFAQGTKNLKTAVTFDLKHGDQLIFDNGNGTDGLPSGTIYTLTETQAPRYRADVTIWNNTTDLLPASGATASEVVLGKNLTISEAPAGTKLILGEDNNRSEWVNTYEDVTPTGILLNNLPFILLIVLAVGGFVGYIANKRRKASN